LGGSFQQKNNQDIESEAFKNGIEKLIVREVPFPFQITNESAGFKPE